MKPIGKSFGYQIWAKIGPETRFFCHFLKFDSLVFLEIAYSYSLQQCLTCLVEVKSSKKFFGTNICAKGAKIGPEARFLANIFKFGSLVFLEITCNDSLKQCITIKEPKSGPKLGVFLPFSKVWFISFPLNCVGW